jgi:hypothetical protein
MKQRTRLPQTGVGYTQSGIFLSHPEIYRDFADTVQSGGTSKMGSSNIGTFDQQPKLAIVVYKRAVFAPADDVYTENPMGAYRGLAFAMVFNVLLVLTGAAGWVLWRLMH